jgi:hypothetical protein
MLGPVGDSGFFHSVRNFAPLVADGVEVREFLGDGSAVLLVPGLQSLVSVQVGRTPIDLTRDYQFPVNSDFYRKVTTTLPQAAVVAGDDGVPILVRSKHSNDGVWQKGETVFVGGIWSDSSESLPDASVPSLPVRNGK